MYFKIASLENPKFSSLICHECFQIVQTLLNFKQTCNESQEYFNNLLLDSTKCPSDDTCENKSVEIRCKVEACDDSVLNVKTENFFRIESSDFNLSQHDKETHFDKNISCTTESCNEEINENVTIKIENCSSDSKADFNRNDNGSSNLNFEGESRNTNDKEPVMNTAVSNTVKFLIFAEPSLCFLAY